LNTEEIRYLIEKYNNHTASPDERILVEQWYNRIDGTELAQNEFNESDTKSQIFKTVNARIEEKMNKKKPLKLKLVYSLFFKAAIIIMVLLAGTYIYQKQTKQLESTVAFKTKKANIMPGGDNAMLLLADGSQIILNKTADGQIADQSGVNVVKTKNGELTYRFAGNTDPKSSSINTVITPRGGQYHLVLVDGTEVWLNAGSSIKFPTAFNGNDRKVEVSGEVYFEVAKNKAKPFIVHTNQSDIKVLGTHFNVNAYEDEEYQRTTLLEGSVEITRGTQKVLLTPGQQAKINEKSDYINIKEIEDPDAIIAWKNGYFQFEKSDLQSVMRQVSRWYNTEVSYNGAIPTKQYTGKIPRGVNVAKLIEMLSYSGIHCEVERNQITVNPK
jgi:transmembrane sensor